MKLIRFVLYNFPKRKRDGDSIAGDAEEVAHDVKLLEVILLVEVSVVLGLPEAARAHMQTTLALLQADQRGQVLVIR